MPSQIPAFRLTVERQMEAYRERLASRLNAELIRRGEQPRDLAYALNIEPRTVERWVAAETFPQRRHLKATADHLGLSVDELRPDLEAEEKARQAQLNRIEAMVTELHQVIVKDAGARPQPAAAAEEAEAATAAVGRRRRKSA